MDEEINYILQEWIYEWDYFEPTHYPMKGDQFERKCLNAWAAKEVVETVKNHPMEDPLEVINNLRDKSDNFCCMAKTSTGKVMFLTLYEVSTNALDFLISYDIRR